MQNPRELFLHELGDILYAERMIEKMLPTLAEEVADPELQQGYRAHMKDTRGHIANLEKAFKALGEPVKAEQCPGIEGLKREHDEFLSEGPSPEVLTLFDAASATRVEHYEIAAYTGLIASARAMGEKEVADLLSENLKQEKEMLAATVKAHRRLSRESARAAKRAKTTA